jgi:hypothetical protein
MNYVLSSILTRVSLYPRIFSYDSPKNAPSGASYGLYVPSMKRVRLLQIWKLEPESRMIESLSRYISVAAKVARYWDFGSCSFLTPAKAVPLMESYWVYPSVAFFFWRLIALSTLVLISESCSFYSTRCWISLFSFHPAGLIASIR